MVRKLPDSVSMNSSPRPSRSFLLTPRIRTFILSSLVCLWSNLVRADAAIVNNFSTAVPGFTNVGSAGCLQEFTGGG